MWAAFQSRDQQGLHLACTLTKRLTELDCLVKHGRLPSENTMLLPMVQSVKGADFPLLQAETSQHQNGQGANASRPLFNVALQRSSLNKNLPLKPFRKSIDVA